jgi:DME family drug/metabolite transporter
VRSCGAVGAVLVAAVLFGTTGTAQELGPDSTTPLGVGAVRLLVGGLALLAVLPLLGTPVRAALRLWTTPAAAGAGLCAALYQVGFFAGVQAAGVAVGTLVTIGSGPVFAGALARLLLGERTARSWLGATVLCVAGLALLTLTGGGSDRTSLRGCLLALGAGLAYAAYTVLCKRLLEAGHASGPVMAATFGLGGLLLVPVLLTEPLGWLAAPSGLATAAWLGLVATTAAYLLFGRGLAQLPAGPVATLVLAEPLVATVLGTAVLGERLTAAGGAGAALVLAGVAVQGLASSRRGPAVLPA